MSNNTHAVGPLKGYLLQVRHMLFELISLEEIFVSIELYDDVAVQSSDGLIIAEQIKSVTSDNNPTTDRSAVLWKTFYNWLNYVRNGSLTLDKTRFRMVVASNHKLNIDDILDEFNKSSTNEQAQKALHKAKSKLWGKNGELRTNVPESYGKYLDELFSTANEDFVTQIVVNFSINIHENNYDENLIKKFNNQPIPQEFAENLITYMLGWIEKKVNIELKQGQPAIISSVDYRNELTAQIRMYNQQNSILALSGEIASEDARTEVKKQDIYIQQLDLIEIEFDDKLEAASDYLRTKTETTIRAEKGIFTPQSLEEYNDKLLRLWKNKRNQVLLLANSDVEKGKQLYSGTGEAVIHCKIQGSETPSFFGNGTLQALANEPPEAPKIGWHPKYKELLNGGKQNE